MAPVASFRVTLQPSGHSFTTDGSDTVLQAALDAGLTLPYGCRNGACGACKGKVLDGLVDHGAARTRRYPRRIAPAAGPVLLRQAALRPGAGMP
jgi:ferredoxin